MLRLVAYLLVSVLLISVVRSIMGVILKGFADLFHPSGPQQPNANASAGSRNLPAGGELKKDPVCGTYVSAATSVKKSLGGDTYYFCSADCRDKFRAKTA